MRPLKTTVMHFIGLDYTMGPFWIYIRILNPLVFSRKYFLTNILKYLIQWNKSQRHFEKSSDKKMRLNKGFNTIVNLVWIKYLIHHDQVTIFSSIIYEALLYFDKLVDGSLSMDASIGQFKRIICSIYSAW